MPPEALLDMPGQPLTVTFRGDRVRVLAAQDLAGQQARRVTPRPVTDLLHLEFLTGAGEAPDWPRPVALHAVIEARANPVLAIRRASRWASYAARIAVVRESRITDLVLLEARLWGIWVVAAQDGQFRVIAEGQRGPVPGSARGLYHRLLDELVWQELNQAHGRTPAAAGGRGKSR